MTITEILASKPVTENSKKPNKAMASRNRAAFSAWYGRLSHDDRKAYDAHCDSTMRAAVAAPKTEQEQRIVDAMARDVQASTVEIRIGRISKAEAEEMSEDLGDYSHHT